MMNLTELFEEDPMGGGFHDVVYDITGESMSPDELKVVFEALPEHIQDKAHQWGLSDTVFRDHAYRHLETSPPREDSWTAAAGESPSPGIPRGRLFVVCGHESRGKMTFAQVVAAAFEANDAT